VLQLGPCFRGRCCGASRTGNDNDGIEWIKGKLLSILSVNATIAWENVMIQDRGDTIAIRAGVGRRVEGELTGSCAVLFVSSCHFCFAMYARHFLYLMNTRVDGLGG